MLTYNSEDIFSAGNSPEMIKELHTLKEKTAHTPMYFKAEIIISYLKNHSVKTNWIEANPLLVKLMVSNSCATSHIESLFVFCRNNQSYLCDYETYIRMHFSINPRNDSRLNY